MNPLNDDQLNELLRRSKEEPPQVSAGFNARVMQAYQRQLTSRIFQWRRLLASAALILVGVAADRALLITRADSVVTDRATVHPCTNSLNVPGLEKQEHQR